MLDFFSKCLNNDYEGDTTSMEHKSTPNIFKYRTGINRIIFDAFPEFTLKEEYFENLKDVINPMRYMIFNKNDNSFDILMEYYSSKYDNDSDSQEFAMKQYGGINYVQNEYVSKAIGFICKYSKSIFHGYEDSPLFKVVNGDLIKLGIPNKAILELNRIYIFDVDTICNIKAFDLIDTLCKGQNEYYYIKAINTTVSVIEALTAVENYEEKIRNSDILKISADILKDNLNSASQKGLKEYKKVVYDFILDEINDYKTKWPYQLLFEAIPQVENPTVFSHAILRNFSDLFNVLIHTSVTPKDYEDMKIFYTNIDQSRKGSILFKNLEMHYKGGSTVFCTIDVIKRAANVNRDVIFKGYKKSELSKNIIDGFNKIGLANTTAIALGKADIFSVDNLYKCNKKELYDKLTQMYPTAEANKMITKIDRLLQNESCSCNMDSSEKEKENEKKISIKINVTCPHCNASNDISLDGVISEDGYIKLYHKNIGCFNCHREIDDKYYNKLVRRYGI